LFCAIARLGKSEKSPTLHEAQSCRNRARRSYFLRKNKTNKKRAETPAHTRASAQSLARKHPPTRHSLTSTTRSQTHTHTPTHQLVPTHSPKHPPAPTHTHSCTTPPNPTVVGQAVHRRGRRKWSFKTWSSSNPTPPAHTNTNTELGEPGTGPVTGTG
jgi:hypothetical protein